MAQIDDIVTEFRTITTAFASINTFFYSHITELNTDLKQSPRPILLLQSAPPTQMLSVEDHTSKLYTLTFGIYDDYNRSERSAKSLEVKQAEVELIMEQFIQEFTRRSVETPKEWYPSSITFRDIEKIDYIGNSKLIGTECIMQLRVDSSCETGTFNY